ncbi:MAG: ABC transporter permease [Gammaproteobacteria bacterium]|nr:ABC transporter permease [Gammaproteobacteria bacterium]
MVRAITRLGEKTIEQLEHLGHLTVFLMTVISKLFVFPFRYRAVLQQLYFIGAKSTFVIFLASITIGLALGLNLYVELSRLGVQDRLGTAVSLSIVRELGPVITALMVMGRAGSAICAEVGIMRSDEQLDALECMAIDPFKFLMVPKFWATLISVPLLVAIADVIGVFGGYIAGVVIFDVPYGAYWQGVYTSIDWQHLNMGLIKSLVFALVIVWVATGKGFLLHLDKAGVYGAEGVSRVTTQAVVMGSILILFFNFLVSAFMVA